MSIIDFPSITISPHAFVQRKVHSVLLKEVKAAVGLQAHARETAAPGVCFGDYIAQVNLGEQFIQAPVTVPRTYLPSLYAVIAQDVSMNTVERKFCLLLVTDCKLSLCRPVTQLGLSSPGASRQNGRPKQKLRFFFKAQFNFRIFGLFI
jgi:hypothetical protein